MRQSRKYEPAELGETVLRSLRGPVFAGVRKQLSRWRDPRARLIRQRRRAKSSATAGAVATGTLGVGSYLSYAPHTVGFLPDAGLETLLDIGAFGFGGVAFAAGVATVASAVKYRKLTRIPLPEAPPEPIELPPSGSRAHAPMRRLRDAEQSLHNSLQQLSAAGVGGDAASDTRATADNAAVALRQVAARLRAVETAIPHAPETDRAELRADVERLGAELDEGVEGYGALVGATSRVVAASGAPEQKDLLQDATDRLAGLASALKELSSKGGGWGASGPYAEAPAEPRQARGGGQAERD